MADNPGDQSRMPPSCRWSVRYDPGIYPDGAPIRCPSLRTVSETMETETVECSVCGRRYTLYDDEMK